MRTPSWLWRVPTPTSSQAAERKQALHAIRAGREAQMLRLGVSRTVIRGFSTSHSYRRLPLAYDLYEPPKAKSGAENGSVILMHGLFGSKRNNRSISKYDYRADLVIVPCSPPCAPGSWQEIWGGRCMHLSVATLRSAKDDRSHRG